MKLSFSSVFTKLILGAAVSASLASCDDPEYPTPTPATTPSTSQGRYLVVNAAPNSGSGQLVSIDNVNVATPPAAVPYLSTSGAYTTVTAGSRLLLFSTPTNLNNQLIPARATFGTNTASTVFLTDLPTRAASGTDLGGIRSIVLADNLAAPAAGKAKIRFVNLATSGTYGIFITGASPVTPLFPVAPTRSSRGTTTTINGSTFNFANFIEVDARAYALDIRSSSTATPALGTQQIINFAAGKIYTLYIRGTAASATPTATSLGISTVLHN